MIYLNCEVKSGLGEDTFWTWFEREFSGCCFDIPTKLRDEDILLRYSTLGFLPIEGKQVALCWELYPQMKSFFDVDQWNPRLEKIFQCARYATYRTVATEESVQDYSRFGSVDVIPIGVNTELYKPLGDKAALRNKYNLPADRQIGIWIGTCHPMKGYGELLKFASEHPDIHWIIVWKWKMEALPMKNATNFIKIPQARINELLNAADFFLSTNKLSSYAMAEWEAMASNTPIKLLDHKQQREFIPSANPRDDVFARGWDRLSARKLWEKFFDLRGIKW